MAHFAEIDNRNVVIRVIVVPDDQEYRGQEYISQDLRLGGNWVKTSYNTINGIHLNGGVPLRKNYAGVGYVYDPILDEFNPPSLEETDK